jgi:hypothetical protein
MAKGEKAEDSENGGLLKSLTSNSLIKGLFDKLFALVGIVIAAMVVSQIFAYPEFMIYSNTTYVEFAIPESITKNEKIYKNDLWWQKEIPVKSIEISAKNYYNPLLKNYDYPIFLNYSFVDDKGNPAPKIQGIKVSIDPKDRQIFADGEKAKVTIAIEGNVTIQDYNLRIWGRGGGGESFRIGQGPLQSVNVESSGREPMHYCTVTIIVNEAVGSAINVKNVIQVDETMKGKHVADTMNGKDVVNMKTGVKVGI